jgi:hypothetical protein
LSWAELLRHAAILNPSVDVQSPEKDDFIVGQATRGAPMLTYVAIAPMLAQTGVAYMKYLDTLLEQVDSGVEGLPSIQMVDLAKRAVSMMDNEYLNEREKMHLRTLGCMLNEDYKRALAILMKHLQSCPGDVLALSIAIDLAHSVGDDKAAAR